MTEKKMFSVFFDNQNKPSSPFFNAAAEVCRVFTLLNSGLPLPHGGMEKKNQKTLLVQSQIKTSEFGQASLAE